MILLDTDHVSCLKYPASERGVRLTQKLDALPAEEEVGVTVITVEEQMRGWLATIAKEKSVRRQITPYRELADLFQFFAEFTIALFDERATDQFEALRANKIRLGTMDLKIAAIALVNQALLLSANRRDFERVSGLHVENWLEA
jgi:tRNA(fMet)-specific endonuclease VapC